jgi:hypothetical protein
MDDEEKEAPKEKEPEPDEDEERDGFRLRFGTNMGGGIIEAPTGTGGVVAFAGRLGAQINHSFGIYYQNTPMLTFTPESTADSAGFKAGFIDYNSLLGSVTLLHFLEVAGGPSLDYVAVASCSATFTLTNPNAGCESTSKWVFGLHGRGALILGGVSGDGPRRSGFAIGADIHPAFLPEGTTVSFTLGIGGEWY